MSEQFICPICGEPTRKYMGNYRKDKLCGKHADEFKAGKIEQCADCSSWHEVGKPCKCKIEKLEQCPNCLSLHKPNEICKCKKEKNKAQNKKETICPICGNNANGKEVCYDCYFEILNKQEEIDKNQKPWELRDYYHNLNGSIYRLKHNEYAKGQIYKLFSIAWLLRDLYKDTALTDRVTTDAKKIIEKRKNNPEFQISEEKQRTDKAIAATASDKNRAADGHICKSFNEVTIDNFLYDQKICHAYGLRVKEIPNTERSIYADWYIPLSGPNGIYIEYWGMDKQDYQENKKEKLEIYEKYKDRVKLIQIEKDDIKDSQNLRDDLYQKLIELGWAPNKT